MTTPAVNLTERTSGSYQNEICEYGRNGVLIRCYPSTVSGSSEFRRQIRPVSATSPIRADGTRGPRGWGHRWGTGVMPTATRIVETKPNGLGEYRKWTERDPLLPTFGNSWDTTLTACEAGWLRELNPSVFPPGVEYAARTKFLGKLRDERIQLGETLAEIHKTAGLVKDLSLATRDFLVATAKAVRRPIPTVIDVLRRAKHIRNKGQFRRWAKNKAERQIIDNWLKFQFGVMPIVYDIQAASGALDLLLADQKPARVKVKAGSTEEWRVNARFTGKAYGYAVQPIKHTASCHISAVYDMDISRVRTSQQLGLGNPIALGYQLMPFSWLIDYVVNIGDWLESLVPVDGARFFEGSMSKIYRLVPDGVLMFQPQGNYVLKSGFTNQVISISAGRFERTVITDVFPAIRPVFQDAIGLKQMANALAGLVKLVKKF